MTLRPKFPHYAVTRPDGLSFTSIQRTVLHEAQQHNLSVTEQTDKAFAVETHYGQYRFEQEGERIAVAVASSRRDWLFLLKDQFVKRLEELQPDTANALRWSDSSAAGEPPLNLHFADLQSVSAIGTSFLRLRVRLADLSTFTDDSIHFRLLLPPEGIDPVEWPVLAENGTTVWPQGKNALHRPVYTVRWLDKAAGLLDFDVFLHDGGRITNWAQNVQPGATVALIGPVGGGIPSTQRLLAFGDETALPAIARILEMLPDSTIGHVTIATRDGAFCAYPLTTPTGVSVSWIETPPSGALAELAKAAQDELPNHFLWFAAEKSEVLRVREHYKSRGKDNANAYISAFWSKP